LNDIVSLALAVSITGGLAYMLTSLLAPWLVSKGIYGVDIHKPSKPIRAEMGGLAVLIALSLGATVVFLLLDPLSDLFLAGLITLIFVGCVGILDDVVGIRQRYKPFMVAASSIPLAIALFDRSSIYFPLIGSVSFGILYPLLVVPLAVTTSANFSNMLAGFNGLEAGNACIALGTLTILSFYFGQFDGAALGLMLFAGYLGFLKFNWYPAKIFPGDTGTLLAGAGVATIGLMSGLEFAAIMLSIPAAIDFTLKMLSKRPFAQRVEYGNSQVGKDGYLVPALYPALAHAFMRLSPLTEEGLVKSLLSMELLYAFLAAIITIVKI
jgi:UDP-N-acetylglucosamine--dolichyl-phosphate N-acetylglucosaminephosphotransferase